MDSSDIVIIGGGLVGATLYHALKQIGLSVLLADSGSLSVEIGREDPRVLALSPATKGIFQHLGFWDEEALNVCAIDKILVSESGCFGRVSFDKKAHAPLGYVVKASTLLSKLYRAIPEADCLRHATLTALNLESNVATFSNKTLTSTLWVASDGTFSAVREAMGLPVSKILYHQHAIVSEVLLETSHHGLALERFTAGGSLALLPMAARKAALIWILPSEVAKKFKALPKNDFLAVLSQACGASYPRFTALTASLTLFPIMGQVMSKKVHWPVVFLGNAAQTLHPLAAQGFNLGIRDVATLIDCIKRHGLNASMLAAYEAARIYDHRVIPGLTHGLQRLFSASFPGSGFLRGMGLFMVDNSHFLKQSIKRHASGFAGIVPDLVFGTSTDFWGE